MKVNLAELTDNELIELYSALLNSLKDRNIIRTNNLVGDLGETLAINFYNSESDLPNLLQAEPNEKAYDALTENNERYTIKSTSTNQTGIFWGLEPKESKNEDRKIFDKLVIVKFDKNYSVESIYEMTWDQFLIHKNWHETTKAWNIRLTKKLLKEVKMKKTTIANKK